LNNKKQPKATVRQSNFELLRIVAMFMVLALHANYASLGVPTREQLIATPDFTLGRMLLEGLCIVAVNSFVLISGWFGIRWSRRGAVAFCWQVLFYGLVGWLWALAIGREPVTLLGLKRVVGLASPLWFVMAYGALYIISPVLNAFVETASRGRFRTLLIAIFLFQFTYGWTCAADFIEAGYSCFSLSALYLLARYMRLYGVRLSSGAGWGLYLGATILNLALMVFVTLRGWVLDSISYVNPLVVAASVGLFFVFASLKMRPNRLINWLGGAAFAVYLLHCNYYLFQPYFLTTVRTICRTNDPASALALTALLCLATYLLATLLELLRHLLSLLLSLHCRITLKQK
jgi:surface polysaccharide O-acyltransferase-like enzyme